MAKTHSKLSPSSADRWWPCPGSVALSADLPEPPQSHAAAEGTVAHDILERCLLPMTTGGVSINPHEFVGDEVKADEEVITVTEEMAEAVSFAIDEIRSELQKHKNAILLSEQKVEIRPGISGTLDICVVVPFTSVRLFDFKYGKGVLVHATDNHQMLMYALPVAEKYEAEVIELTIIQPRTEGQTNSWTVPEGYLEGYKQELERHIELTKEPNAPLQDGDHCRWCRARAICPKLREGLCKELTCIEGKELIFPDVAGLPLETVTTILNVRDKLEAWLNAVEVHAFNILSGGGDVPGYELGKKRANREWANEEEAAKEFADLGEKAFKVKLLSPAQMEKLAGKDRVKDLVITPDNGLTLKRKGGDKKTKKSGKGKNDGKEVIDVNVLD